MPVTLLPKSAEPVLAITGALRFVNENITEFAIDVVAPGGDGAIAAQREAVFVSAAIVRDAFAKQCGGATCVFTATGSAIRRPVVAKLRRID